MTARSTYDPAHEALPASSTAETRAGHATPTPDWRVDLLRPVNEMITSLAQQTNAASYLNAFLLAVAIQQAVDDQLASATVVDRAAEYLGKQKSVGATIASASLRRTARAARSVSSAARTRRALTQWRRDIDALVADLATIVLDEKPAPESPRLQESLDGMVKSARRLPTTVRNAIPVLPSCFQTFDLAVVDVRRLGYLVAESLTDSPGPVMVVGVRTSGSYLAPLIAAALRARDRSNHWGEVATLTLRPGVPLQRIVANNVRAAAQRGATFVVTDDPPVSGSSLARAADELKRLGVQTESVTFAFPRFTGETTELAHLAGYRQVCLPWSDWAVHARLTPDAVQADLALLLGDRVRVESVHSLGCRNLSRSEAHVRARFRVHVVDRCSSERRILDVAVQGVGIGYFGEHVSVVAGVMAEYAPHIHGLRGGLLYREWLDDRHRFDDTVGSASGATALAAYAAHRSRRLRVSTDRSLQLAGSRPVWEAAAVEISHSFGRVWPLAQLLAVNRVVRTIMHVAHPSVVDGTTNLENWFSGDDPGSEAIRSVGLQRRAYWHHGLGSYDPAFDLAGAMTKNLDVPFAEAMLTEYGAHTGDVVSPERWLLLRLAQLWGSRRRRADAGAVRGAGARALQEYFAQVFFADVEPVPSEGPVCALDVDGVLETDHLGFPSLTASSAFALRALHKHGNRPVLVTGRGLDDVRERCRNYKLVGGVAEYGSVVYLASGDTVLDLVPTEARAQLTQLRAALASMPDIVVDEAYRFGVRAWTETAGVSAGLSNGVVDAVTADLDHVRVVLGEGQTDFVATTVDKGSGLRRLMQELTTSAPPGSVSTPALAIGDTVSDASMLALARQGAVPGHAPAVLDGPTVWRSPAPYQQGTAQAVDRFVGHLEGTAIRTVRAFTGRGVVHVGCEVCQLRGCKPDRSREALLALLSVNEGGLSGMPLRSIRGLVLSRSLR